MSCCGQKREAEMHPNQPAAAETEVSLEYLGQGAVRVVSPYSRKPYRFSAVRRIQPVDSVDVAAILRTGMLRLRRKASL